MMIVKMMIMITMMMMMTNEVCVMMTNEVCTCICNQRLLQRTCSDHRWSILQPVIIWCTSSMAFCSLCDYLTCTPFVYFLMAFHC